jgi:hypothetical protein
MDETRPRIVAYTAAAEREGRIPQGESIDARDSDIDGVRLHMEAAFGDARRAGAQELVAPRSSVAANDLDLCIWTPDGRGHIREDIKRAWVIVFNLSGAMITEEMIELLFGFRHEGIASLVDDIDPLTRVRMVQAKVTHLAIGRIGWRGAVATNEHRGR